jgi:hypothetical protein
MKRFDISILYSLFFTILVLAGCNKKSAPEEPDSTKPGFTITEPQSGNVLSKSGEILLSGTFTDNDGLKKCTLSLSYNGEKGVSIVEPVWEPEDDVIIMSGTEYTLTDKNIFGEAIPSDILTGSYIIDVSVEDISGNTATGMIEITIE